MTLVAGLTRTMRDAVGRNFGTFEIESVRGDLILGQFEPGPDFGVIEALVLEFEECVNGFVLSFVDELAAKIEAFGIQFDDGTPLRDIQIYSDGASSCRLVGTAERNGHAIG
jgi:hypothetical protein